MYLFFLLANINVLEGTVGLESSMRHISSAVNSNHNLDL